MQTSSGAPLPKDSTREARRRHAAWHSKRLLSEAAAQLYDVVRCGADAQQAVLGDALRSIEQVCDVLTPIAARPLRSRRYSYSPKWRRRFAAVLRERRESRGLSRQQLAERSKLSVTIIRNIETLRSHPELGTIEQLLSVPELDLTWSDLDPLPLAPKKNTRATPR